MIFPSSFVACCLLHPTNHCLCLFCFFFASFLFKHPINGHAPINKHKLKEGNIRHTERPPQMVHAIVDLVFSIQLLLFSPIQAQLPCVEKLKSKKKSLISENILDLGDLDFPFDWNAKQIIFNLCLLMCNTSSHFFWGLDYMIQCFEIINTIL